MMRRTPSALALAAASLWGAAAGALAQPARPGFGIRIVEPENQAILLGRTRIRAAVTVSSTELVDRVEFYVGDALIFVDREPPYECVYDFGEVSKSSVIRAVAYHVEGVRVEDFVIGRRPLFHYVSEVNRVLLWVTVTDKQDRLVTDLTRDQFRVFEDGVEQQILEFYPEDRPLTIAILIDSSGSMQDSLGEVHRAASAFVDTLRAEDRACVIDFDEHVFLIEDFTGDKEALKKAITSTEALGATALYDALHAAFRKLRDAEGRRAVVLLSDGEDTQSRLSYPRVLEEAKSHPVIIYGIGLGAADRRVIRELSEVTGGRAFFVDKAEELAGVYERIAEELRRQLYVTYSTSNTVWDGRWIEVRVEVKDPRLRTRHRHGFFAVRSGALGEASPAGSGEGGGSGSSSGSKSSRSGS